MLITLSFDDEIYDIDVPDKLIADAQDFYAKMNTDMDKGWQISRTWIENLNTQQRCQVVAEKILQAFQEENQQAIILMSGYIINQLPGVKRVNIDTSGDMSMTEFLS